MEEDSVRRRIIDGVARGEWVVFDRIAPTADADETDAGQADAAPASGDAQSTRPEVDGGFLASLWKGAHAEAQLTESGIQLSGLRITGAIELFNTKGVNGAREGLPLMVLHDCEIEELSFSRARLSDFVLTLCEVAIADFEDVDVSGTLSFANTHFRDRIDISRARIAGDILFQNCELHAGIDLDNATVERELTLARCILSEGEDGNCFRGVGLRSFSRLSFDRTRCSGYVTLNDLHAGSLKIDRSSFRGPGHNLIDLNNAQIEGEFFLARTICRGSIDASYSATGGRVRIFRLSLWKRNGEISALLLQAAAVAKDMSIESSRIANLVLMDARVAQNISITRCRFSRAGQSVTGHLMALNCQAQQVRIVQCAIENALTFSSARIFGDFEIRNSTIGGAHRPEELWAPARADIVADLSFAAFGYLRIRECHLSGGLLLRDSSVASPLVLERVLVKAVEAWSIQMEGVTSPSIVTLDRLALSKGLAMPGLKCSELQIKGGLFHPREIDERYPYAIWASECQIGRRLQFAMHRDTDRNGNKIREPIRSFGRLDFSNSTFEEAVVVRGLEARAGLTADGLAEMTVLDLSRCVVKGDVRLFNQRYGHSDLEPRETPARLWGCVTIDKAEVQGDVELNGIEIRHLGVVTGKPRTAETEAQITDCKRGVVLSMFRARIKGDLIIGHPHLYGIVDLRNAAVRMIQDGSGRRWERAHVKPGGLLLDGLHYDDLDHVIDGEPAGASRAEDLAFRRLHWLKMQFPGRRPDSERFVAQPYEQLARMFAEEGEDRARRRVQLEKRELQRKYGRVNLTERLLGGLLKVTSDYGYSPGRAALWLVLFIMGGAVIAEWLHGHDMLVLADDDMNLHTAFDPLVYAIDVAIPVVDLGQDGTFIFARDHLPPWPHAEQILMIGKAAYQLLGLALASITILTLTGVLREKE